MENNNRQGCRWVKASERLPLKEDQYFIYVPTLTMKKVSTFNGKNFEHQFTNKDFEWLDESTPIPVQTPCIELEKENAELKLECKKLVELFYGRNTF